MEKNVLRTKKGRFKIRPAKPNFITTMCEYFAMHSNLKTCNVDPRQCIMGVLGKVSKGGSFTPSRKGQNATDMSNETLRNCPKLKAIEVYDNNDKAFDRYTVIVGKDVFTMSTNANSPQGFNQYAGALSELKIERKNRVPFADLPQDVKTAIFERMIS